MNNGISWIDVNGHDNVAVFFGNYKICVCTGRGDLGKVIMLSEIIENNSDDPLVISDDAKIKKDGGICLVFNGIGSTNPLFKALECVRKEYESEE